jgi:hypothetical protein
VIAAVHDLSVLFVLVALGCFIAAGVCAYRTLYVAALVLAAVGVVALIYGA